MNKIATLASLFIGIEIIGFKEERRGRERVRKAYMLVQILV